ncbi:transcription factor TFIID complex subunit Taf13 [Polychytrium aggregatum]|uniref:transcription factor TFIID complex subunit Taf13 n=1 Tax=Polychytrium aggregatum TaxID=110093 RepID=UPI0022FDF1F4|nr:transcription factor TFIID complex subunit Taf13 [Polychytrium aggregatum]KAI9202175.1 transcription factor TFIID complex subunit Taf13 [Polychytrium aggregatum]
MLQTRHLATADLAANTVKQMLYGFGDVINPAPDTVDLMDEMLQEFIVDLCLEAMKSSNNKVLLNDFLFALRHDPKKYARAHELLEMAKKIARDKRIMDIEDLVANEKALE